MKSSKIIDISKSSLVSLKAELLRKQEEVCKARAETQTSYIQCISQPKERVKHELQADIEKTSEDSEYEELLRKSRSALEEKSKLYNKLLEEKHCSNSEDGGFLVDFDQKCAELQENSSEIHGTSPLDDGPDNSDDDWVDFVDCLGRTRRCLKHDLSFMKEKDLQLANSLGLSIDIEINKDHEVTTASSGDFCKTHREELRKKWEEQEEVVKMKKDLHYQDVLFDEARAHGVSYYAFARDEDERRRQQAALAARREDSRQQQAAAAAVRQCRRATLEGRLRAARARQHARLGLPPPAPGTLNAVVITTRAPELEDAPGDEISEIDLKEAQSTDDGKEVQSRKRAQYVRPWDVGKSNTNVSQAISQEEWIKKKRSDRNLEFAPPPNYTTSDSSIRPRVDDCEIRAMGTYWPPEQNKKLHQFSKNQKKDYTSEASSSAITGVLQHADLKKIPPRQTTFTYVKTDVTIKDSTKQHFKTQKSSELPTHSEEQFEVRSSRLEIASPETREYYGRLPPLPHAGGTTAIEDIEKSISAGLRFLRNQHEAKRNLPQKGLLDEL